ncbi:MAG: multi-sensor signal transduction histidine kinase [Syntrophaceae bacterium]|nr:MAG: multi-sensor signal transduction histidine kinase [Syntrophaceae bacterium]
MLLDMRTIIFSYVITDIVCLVVMVLLWQQTRRRFAGTVFFVFDFALQTTALFLIVLRGQIPDWMSMVLANALAMTGALLGYLGLLRFFGKKSAQIHNYILLAAFVLIHAYFALVQPDLAVRNLNISVVLLIICFQCAWLLLRGVEPGIRQLTWGVGIVFTGYCVMSVIRIAEFFITQHVSNDYFQPGLFEPLVMVSYQIWFILLTYSLALMFNKRLMLEIATQEEKFSKAFHSSPYAVTITRMSDGQIIEVNEGFLNITGYQLADVKGNSTIGMHLWDREEDRAFVIGELASKGKVYDREFQFRIKSDKRITGLFSAEIITINNEKCILASINDITKRKEAEKAIQRNELRLRKLLDILQHPSETIQGFLDYALEQAIELTESKIGYIYHYAEDRKEFVLNTWSKGVMAECTIANPQTRYELDKTGIWGEAVRQRRSIIVNDFQDAHPLKKGYPAGHAQLLKFMTIPIFRGESIVGVVGVANKENDYNETDILQASLLMEAVWKVTDRKQAEDALRESERQYKNLFENSMEGIFQTTPEGKLISANMALAKIFGYECPEEMIGAVHDIAGQLYANSAERKKATNVLREKGYLKKFECQMRRKDGTTFWALINAILTENQSGANYFEGFIIDINDRKRAEEEIIGLNVELEKKVLSRTHDLRNSQLALLSIVEDLNASNQKVAFINQSLEATNKELESFSYSVSHDLRAPLRSIDGFSQALLEDYQKKFDDTGRNYLARIRAATQNMGMLIDDMLKLSRISRFELRRESVDLSKMFREIAKNTQMDDPARIIDVIIQKDIVVDGDSALLRIALTDLIDNAWKFTGKEARPKIEFGATDLAGKKVVFIRDNGVGFDMAYVDKLFGTFQRLHPKNEFVGTGIGLATVKRIITRHGGEVWAEGEIGKGAVFYFTLPER